MKENKPVFEMFGVTVTFNKNEVVLENATNLNGLSDLEKAKFFNSLEKVIIDSHLTQEEKETVIYNIIHTRADILDMFNPFSLFDGLVSDDDDNKDDE